MHVDDLVNRWHEPRSTHPVNSARMVKHNLHGKCSVCKLRLLSTCSLYSILKHDLRISSAALAFCVGYCGPDENKAPVQRNEHRAQCRLSAQSLAFFAHPNIPSTRPPRAILSKSNRPLTLKQKNMAPPQTSIWHHYPITEVHTVSECRLCLCSRPLPTWR